MTYILPIVSGFILSLGVLDDLRSRKIHNVLLLSLFPFTILSVFLCNGFSWSVLWVSSQSALLALFLGLCLYIVKAIGGGDLKLYFLVAFTWDAQTTGWVLVYALPMSLLFGVVRTILKGEGKTLFLNVLSLVQFKKVKKTQLQTFPFSVALLLGWLSYLLMGQME